MHISLKKQTTVMSKSRGKPMTNIIKPRDEAEQAMTELSPSAYMLLDYYYSKDDGWEFTKAHMMKTLGITERTLQRAKKELIEKRYLHIASGKEVDNYFVGKQQVRDFLSNTTIVVKEPKELPINKDIVIPEA